MERFEDTFEFVLEHGVHTLNFQHLEGDGTLWDFVKLEVVGCGYEEGDVIINEVMWMGSTESSDDEWIELYNDTGSEIDLSNWVLENAGNGDLTLPEGSSIPAGGYFLIGNFASDDGDSALSDSNVSVDWVTTDLELDNSGEALVLKDYLDNTIDETPSGSWPAGEDGDQNKSMERDDVSGDGSNPANWHTCTDAECNDTTYWDVEGDDYGTPASENHSEGDAVVSTESASDEGGSDAGDAADAGDGSGGSTGGESGDDSSGTGDTGDDGSDGSGGDSSGDETGDTCEGDCSSGESDGDDSSSESVIGTGDEDDELLQNIVVELNPNLLGGSYA
jgi:hypothetical protein